MHCTAGVFGGDELDCQIRVRRGARVRITQQSATKVHASQGRLAMVKTRIAVEAGAELQVVYDPVIPFAHSRLKQSTRIDVEDGATLLYWESFMAGRLGHGEAWCFTELAVETELVVSGQLIYLDRFRLQPAKQDPASPWAAGGAPYVATGLYWGPHSRKITEYCRCAMQGAGLDEPVMGLAVARVLTAAGPELCRSQQTFVAGSCALRETEERREFSTT
jgi:urease accessory protein UreH